MATPRDRCYCDEAESFVREQLDPLDVGDGRRFSVPAELTHLPREVELDEGRMALLVSYSHGGLASPSVAEYEVLPR